MRVRRNLALVIKVAVTASGPTLDSAIESLVFRLGPRSPRRLDEYPKFTECEADSFLKLVRDEAIPLPRSSAHATL
jgi:hypothetical protein